MFEDCRPDCRSAGGNVSKIFVTVKIDARRGRPENVKHPSWTYAYINKRQLLTDSFHEGCRNFTGEWMHSVRVAAQTQSKLLFADFDPR